ncbi:unnamed protein product [Rhodiola kirilowii]
MKIPRAVPLLLLCGWDCWFDERADNGDRAESSVSAQVVYNSALDLGIGNQLVNILRDVGEDAMRGRVYLPQDELASVWTFG